MASADAAPVLTTRAEHVISLRHSNKHGAYKTREAIRFDTNTV